MHFKDILVVSAEAWNDENWDDLSQMDDGELRFPLVLTEDLRAYEEAITLENDLEEIDLFSAPTPDFFPDPRQSRRKELEESEARLARRREERDASDLHRKLRGLSTAALDLEIARLDARIKHLLSTAEELRLEAARVSPSASKLWLGKTLSEGTS